MAKVTVPVYDTKGSSVGSQELASNVFSVAFKQAVVHQAVRAQEANAREPLAHTKNRGEVRGGGRKPWKQKGTGRARHGSIRSPLWVGGGITFGPRKERTYTQRINKKVRQAALRMVLSDKVASERFIVVNEMKLDGKTKALATALKALPCKSKRTLLITSAADTALMRAAKNLSKIETIAAQSLNVRDVMKAQYLIVPQALIKTIEKHYA